LGQRIEAIVNDYQQAGWYDRTVDASRLPSGVYIYRIQAGDFVESRRMLLLR
jgi:hypothetical protein